MTNKFRKALLASLLSMSGFVAYAQSTVTGTVKDANGEPLIGVTVMADGEVGAITDIDGNFSIPNATSSTKLTVSYIGYQEQQVAVGNRSRIDIVMQEDNQALDEVVVVGYGTMKKTDLTGSISSVNTDQLNAKGAPSVLENLQGSIPGVNITQTTGRAGNSFDIEIRGKSSNNPNLKPLYIVDGVASEDIDWLNPQDIERIDVLKDASSTAIYGSRATAGVVIVTTKSGTTVGGVKSKPTISYDGYWGFTKVTRMPDFMDGQQFYDFRFRKFLTYAGGALTSGRPIYQMASNTTYNQMAIHNDDTGEYRLRALMENGQTVDWPDLITGSGHQQNHYLAISGATDRLSYHMGIGYSSEDGIYDGDEQDKFNFKGSLDGKINKYVSAGFSFNLARVNHDYASDKGVQYAYRQNVYCQPYDAEGNINPAPGNYLALGSTSNNQFSDQPSPLLYFADNNEVRNRQTWRALGNVYLQINPVKGLTIKSTFSPSYTYYREGYFYDAPVFDDGDTNVATKETDKQFDWTWDNMVTYDNFFGKDHHLNVMGLFSMMHTDVENQFLAYTGVLDGTLWWNLASGTYMASSDDYGDSGNSYTENSMVSYALRANYTFKERYMLTASVRWDGSSRFRKGNRWGSFPSVAVAWRLSEEPFMVKARKWLSNAKLRLSYGVTGNNSGIGDYATQVIVGGPSYYPFGSTYLQGFYPNGIVNADLQWERSHEFNVGLDFGFFDERIRGSVDWYSKTSKDLLFEVPLPLEAGGTFMTTNVGSVRNQGVEVSLTTENIRTKDWRWTTTFTFTHNKNEVREINGVGGNLITGEEDGNLFIGETFNNFYGFEWDGIVSDRMMTVPDNQVAKDNGFTPGTQVKEYDYYYKCYQWAEGMPIIVDRNGDGSFTDDDKRIYNTDPKWSGSFSTTLSYKGWDLSASLYTKQGMWVNSAFYGEYLDYSQRGRTRLVVDNYIPAGTLIDCDGVNPDGTYINPVYQERTHYGSYPFPNYGGNNGFASTSNWISGDGAAAVNKYADASYVKVKHITLGYTFPKKWTEKFGCSYLRLYCTVTNPFVWTDYKGFDPEWASADLDQDGPSTITCQFGANIKF